MVLRCFSWRDIPILHRYRDEMIFLNSELMLKSGSFNTFKSLLFSVLPLDSMLTLVGSKKDNHTLQVKHALGQAYYRVGEEHAYLTFIAPESSLIPQLVFALIDGITAWAGHQGALRILADIEESHPLFEIMRQAGFSVYARQRIWQVVQSGPSKTIEKTQNHFVWRPALPSDWQAIQSLYQSLVPNLIQRVGQPMFNSSRGLVCYQHNDLAAYVEFRYGVNGICAYPLIHPDAPEVVYSLPQAMDELNGITPRLQRPVYALISHYQNWIESALLAQGALVSVTQALMVKHLTTCQQVFPSLMPSLEFESSQTQPLAFVLSGDKNHESCTNHR